MVSGVLGSDQVCMVMGGDMSVSDCSLVPIRGH